MNYYLSPYERDNEDLTPTKKMTTYDNIIFLFLSHGKHGNFATAAKLLKG